MDQHPRIIRFIDLLRGQPAVQGMDENDTSRLIITEVFTEGNCGNFALALQTAFGGTLHRSTTNYHILCKIDGRLYDVTGDVTDLYDVFEVDEQYIINNDFIDNYSFDARGPMI